MTIDIDETEAAEVLKMVRQLAAAYRQEADKFTQQAYLLGLAGIPLVKVRDAIIRAIQSEQFMPTVATLRKMAGAEVGHEARAVVAFDKLGGAVSEFGAYESVCFDDPILNQTIQSLGGWVRICATSLEDWDSHFRHRFFTTYKENAGMNRGTMYAQLGIAAVENGASGLEVKEPILVLTGLPRLPGLSYQHPESRPHLTGTPLSIGSDIGRIDVIDQVSE